MGKKLRKGWGLLSYGGLDKMPTCWEDITARTGQNPWLNLKEGFMVKGTHEVLNASAT